MECTFTKVGNHESCHSKTTKKSTYCRLHNYLIKTSQVKPCIQCGKGTYAKYQICVACGAHKIRLKHRYYEIQKPYKQEATRLRNMLLLETYY